MTKEVVVVRNFVDIRVWVKKPSACTLLDKINTPVKRAKLYGYCNGWIGKLKAHHGQQSAYSSVKLCRTKHFIARGRSVSGRLEWEQGAAVKGNQKGAGEVTALKKDLKALLLSSENCLTMFNFKSLYFCISIYFRNLINFKGIKIKVIIHSIKLSLSVSSWSQRRQTWLFEMDGFDDGGVGRFRGHAGSCCREIERFIIYFTQYLL